MIGIKTQVETLACEVREEGLDAEEVEARLLEFCKQARAHGARQAEQMLQDALRRVEMIGLQICAAERRGALLEVLAGLSSCT